MKKLKLEFETNNVLEFEELKLLFQVKDPISSIESSLNLKINDVKRISNRTELTYKEIKEEYEEIWNLYKKNEKIEKFKNLCEF